MKAINSKETYSKLCRDKGLNEFEALMNFVQSLPYGRNKERSDLTLVLKEERGTCSSKHAFLKKVADENNFKEVKLVLGIYKMCESNTLGIGSVIVEAGLEYIPEAHCYLSVNGKRLDLTSGRSNISKIEMDILKEQFIEAEDTISNKVTLHQEYLKHWINEKEIPFTFEEIWKLREQCIFNLSE